MGSDGRKLDLNVVRVGHGAFNKDKQDKGPLKNSRQSDEMRRVVHRVSLDYLVEEKMKQHKANESVSKQFLKYIDIRKKVKLIVDDIRNRFEFFFITRCWRRQMLYAVHYHALVRSPC